MQELERSEMSKNECTKILESKQQENNDLLDMVKELEQLTESQSRTLVLKESQIEALETKSRLLENERLVMEKKNQENSDLKNRNKRCIETISKSSSEMNELKKELDGVMGNQRLLESRVFEKESLIIELNHQIKVLKGQIEKYGNAIEERDRVIEDLRSKKYLNFPR